MPRSSALRSGKDLNLEVCNMLRTIFPYLSSFLQTFKYAAQVPLVLSPCKQQCLRHQSYLKPLWETLIHS